MFQEKCVNIQDFSNHLFWDVDRNDFDVDKNFSFLVKRVLEYGVLKDWMLLYNNFGLDKITLEAKKLRSLDTKSMHFIARLSNTSIEEFKCYTLKQSIPGHWNF